MSDIERRVPGKAKRSTLTLKKSGANESEALEGYKNASGLDQESSPSDGKLEQSGSVVDSGRRAEKKRSPDEILLDVFSSGSDKRGHHASAKISKVDLKILAEWSEPVNLPISMVDALLERAKLTDPALDCVAEIALGVVDSGRNYTRGDLFTVCVQMASGLWINKHNESSDLYRDLIEGADDSQDFLRILDESLKQAYSKRLKMLLDSGSQPSPGSGAEPLKDQADVHKERKKLLIREQKNIFLIGVLWLLRSGKYELPVLVDSLVARVISEGETGSSLRDTALFLIRQLTTPDKKVVGLLQAHDAQIRHLDDCLRQEKRITAQREHKIHQLQADIADLHRKLHDAESNAEYYKNELFNLKQQSEEMQLDERAARTHLRDAEGKVRAKAFNLLSEEVLEPLRLSLAALNRENPKTKVAIHQIDLAVESVERDLQWFKG